MTSTPCLEQHELLAMVTGTSVAESVPLHVDSCGDCQLRADRLRRRSPRSARGHGEDTHCTLSLEPDDAEFWFRKGVAQRHRGEAAAEAGA